MVKTNPNLKKKAVVLKKAKLNDVRIKEKVDSLFNAGSRIYKQLLEKEMTSAERQKKIVKMLNLLEQKLINLKIDSSLYHLGQTQITKIVGKEFCNFTKAFIRSNLKGKTQQESKLREVIVELYDTLYSEKKKTEFFIKINEIGKQMSKAELKEEINIIENLYDELRNIYSGYHSSKKTDIISNAITLPITYTEIIKMTLSKIQKS